MTSSYRMIKESEIKTIIWYNDESQGMPVPIGIFPPSIPDSMIIDMIKVLNDNDVEGKYAVETEKYINSNSPVSEQDEILGEMPVSPV